MILGVATRKKKSQKEQNIEILYLDEMKSVICIRFIAKRSIIQIDSRFCTNQVTGMVYAAEKIYPDGTKYIGFFKNSQRFGQGQQLWPDGQKYVGNFNQDMMNGHDHICRLFKKLKCKHVSKALF